MFNNVLSIIVVVVGVYSLNFKVNDVKILVGVDRTLVPYYMAMNNLNLKDNDVKIVTCGSNIFTILYTTR